MPYIAVEVGSLAPETKQALIQKLTDTAAEVTGIPKGMFMVAIRELPDEDIAIGGRTVREIKQAAGK